jgi:dTDP-4-dehydrorhamnose reductase
VTRVLVLGVTGMLGEMVGRVLASEPGLELVGTARGDRANGGPFPLHRFEVGQDDPRALLDAVRPDWVVNAIGVTKPHIDEGDAERVAAAVDVNARFPYDLASASEEQGARVVQIATDCVYSGREGGYREDAAHDALDVYGKSKSLGEVPAPCVTHLRCSIVGPERSGGSSLLAWVLGHERSGVVPGFTDHVWNGVTTWHFGRLCAAILREELELPALLHVVPADAVTKAELVAEIADAFGRDDLVVEPGQSASPVDRSLETLHPAANDRLWRAAGYDTPPTVAEMVRELASHSEA